MYLTIIIPCLNEEKTIGECITKANTFINVSRIDASVLVVDNGSTDNSVMIAKELGADVICEKEKGYGNALRKGIFYADSEYVIFGDADCSYDFEHLNDFVEKFKEGYEFVNGYRIPCPGSTTMLHSLGVKFLSLLGRIKFRTKLKDFHCGLRGFKKDLFSPEDFKTTGMEFATEIIAVAAKKKAEISEVKVKLYPDKRGRPSHLRTFKDGFRHLSYIVKH